MSDDHYLRCRTCCTAAMGGDATRVDDEVFKPFIGGIENHGNTTQYWEAKRAKKLAVAIQAVAQSVHVLRDVDLQNEPLFGQNLTAKLFFGDFSDYSTHIDFDFFVAHGSHDLVLHCYVDEGACWKCWFEEKIIKKKHPEHA